MGAPRPAVPRGDDLATPGRLRGLRIEARAFAFSTLVFCELFRALAARSPRLLYWQVGVFTNVHLVAVIALSSLVQISLGHVPFLASLFRIHAMSAPDTAACLAMGLVPVTVLEVGKLLQRVRRPPLADTLPRRG